jgi:hypothetical protein
MIWWILLMIVLGALLAVGMLVLFVLAGEIEERRHG